MKFVTAIALALASSPSFAAMAVSYNCLGKDKVSGNSVILELTFSDHAPEAGYANQSVTIVKKGWENLEKPIVFQMFGATKKNNCQVNEQGEIQLVNDLKMKPTKADQIADYKIRVKSDCADAKVDIQALCSFE